jgi:hypothetical protein
MVSRKQSLLIPRRIVVAGLAGLLLTVMGYAQSEGTATKKFYPDDPLWQEPLPHSTATIVRRDIDDLYDFLESRFVVPGKQEKLVKHQPVPAGNVNTLGEVPDSNWYTNRHGLRRMSIAELKRGTGNTTPPEADGKWRIIAAKSDGVAPGLVIEDLFGHRYILKFDAPNFPELASAADVISSKFFYALGYNTPENYIVHFDRDTLTIGEGVKWHDAHGRKHLLTPGVLDELLKRQPKDSAGMYRALASRFIEGDLVGPFSYKGTRTDDPNDLIPHENRRELRGLRVFAAWLNHTDVKQMNTMDALVTESGRQYLNRYLKHYLMDFGSTLGSDADFPKNPWRGHVYPISPNLAAAKQVATLGLVTPAWLRAHYPKIRGVGAFEADTFEPVDWIPNYPNPAFLMMDDKDAFWAARQVASFTDEEIRAIVETGEFTDPRATDWITKCLIKRRDKIAQVWLSKLLPIDRFRVENDTLVFDDLTSTPALNVRWYSYNNDDDSFRLLANGVGMRIPEAGDSSRYLAAVIDSSSGSANGKSMTVFLRAVGATFEVVGLDRKGEIAK